MKRLYNTPGESGAFSSAVKLHRLLRKTYPDVKMKQVQRWLDDNYTYVIHRARRIKFPRNPIIAKYIDHNWQADILFLADLASFNDRKPCILVCIDVVSRFAWAEPMRSKKGSDTSKTFEKILAKGRKPEKLQTDKGTEFYNAEFKKVLKKHGIKLYSTESDKKAAIAERCIKEIKKLIYRYLTTKQTNKYIDVLQKLLKTYNATYHSGIGMAPEEVSAENEGVVLDNLYGKLWDHDRVPVGAKEEKRKFTVGDVVRISLARTPFTKGYKGFWTTELFTVNAVKRTYPYVQYRLEDQEGEILTGLFYEQELQHATEPTRKYRRIRKILRRKRVKQRDWVLVNWEGEPPSVTRWVLAKTVRG